MGVGHDVNHNLLHVISIKEKIHVAAAVPSATCNTSVTKIVWTVKWSAVGLAPVRPQVLLTRPLRILLDHAIELLIGHY